MIKDSRYERMNLIYSIISNDDLESFRSIVYGLNLSEIVDADCKKLIVCNNAVLIRSFLEKYGMSFGGKKIL